LRCFSSFYSIVIRCFSTPRCFKMKARFFLDEQYEKHPILRHVSSAHTEV
jgi:hypothetical protein